MLLVWELSVTAIAYFYACFANKRKKVWQTLSKQWEKQRLQQSICFSLTPQKQEFRPCLGNNSFMDIEKNKFKTIYLLLTYGFLQIFCSPC